VQVGQKSRQVQSRLWYEKGSGRVQRPDRLQVEREKREVQFGLRVEREQDRLQRLPRLLVEQEEGMPRRPAQQEMQKEQEKE